MEGSGGFVAGSDIEDEGDAGNMTFQVVPE